MREPFKPQAEAKNIRRQQYLALKKEFDNPQRDNPMNEFLKVYMEGWKVGYNSPDGECPYEELTLEWEEWTMGYIKGYEDYEDDSLDSEIERNS